MAVRRSIALVLALGLAARRSIALVLALGLAARRSIALVLAFGLAAAGMGWAAVVGLERAGVPQAPTVLDRLHGLLRDVELAARRTPRGLDVVVVGDSHLMRAGGLPLHVQLERALLLKRFEGDHAPAGPQQHLEVLGEVRAHSESAVSRTTSS